MNDQQIRLSGTINDKGVTGTAGVVGAIALLPVAGFFTTGTSAVIPINTPITAFTDEDLPVTFAGGVPASALVATDAASAPAVERRLCPRAPKLHLLQLKPPRANARGIVGRQKDGSLSMVTFTAPAGQAVGINPLNVFTIEQDGQLVKILSANGAAVWVMESFAEVERRLRN